jgi:hypothetical protein
MGFQGNSYMTKTLAAEIVVDIILFTCKVTSCLEGCGSLQNVDHSLSSGTDFTRC